MADRRWIGGLVLVHTGIGTAFLLGWFAAGSGTTALIGMATGMLSVAIAVLMGRHLRDSAPSLGTAYLMLAGIACTLVAGEQIAGLVLGAMRNVTEVVDPARLLAVHLRNWSHTTTLLVSGLALGLFQLSVARLRWVPRWFSALALAAVLLHLFTAGRPYFGALINYHYLYPLAALQAITGLWMLVRGGKYIEG